MANVIASGEAQARMRCSERERMRQMCEDWHPKLSEKFNALTWSEVFMRQMTYEDLYGREPPTT